MENIPFVFLLGGHDLEMVTIKQLLTDNGFSEGKVVVDYNLQWGAKLSDYQNLFNDEQTFVGIELMTDIKIPLHYIEIDHHNKNTNKSSSLEQVIDLLKTNFGIVIEVTRDLQLVAANDKGYIPALIEIKATKEEIADIRQRDKDAQGITAEDERQAEQSILNHKTTIKGIIIVKSLTSRFATITDRLFPYPKLLIHNDHELTCYGEGVKKLSEMSVELSKNWKVYSGGGENGYWGISGCKLNEKLIKQIIKTFSMEPFSYHIFLFPFKWELDEKGKAFPGNLLKFGWEQKLNNDEIAEYNERKYFHPYVHPCLFEGERTDLIKQFNHKESQGNNWQYEIVLKRRIPIKEIEPLFKDQIIKPPDKYEYDEIDKTFILGIDKITMDIYEYQGIGIFGFHLVNTKHQSPEDILLINQFGRRIFPPFLDNHFPDFDIDTIENAIEGTTYREMPSTISIKGIKGKTIDSITENYETSFETAPFKINDYIPAHIRCFFRENINSTGDYNLIANNEDPNNDAIHIGHVLDDRMFVICWYGAKQLTYEFRKDKLTPKQEKAKHIFVLSDLCQRMRGGYEASGFYRNDKQHRSLALHQTHDSYGYAFNNFWYQYVFVDGYGLSCANEKLRVEQIEKHTYSRWVEANTLYGVSRYSFVCITEPKEILEKPFPNAGFIVDHIQTIYFKMVSLVLAQRAMILKYSDDASKVSQELIDSSQKLEVNKSGKEQDKVIKGIEKLLKDYTVFINRVFHREVTAQEQGIELYDMLQEHLRVEYQAKELEKEIDELHRNADLIENRKSSKFLNNITILGGIFLIPALIASFSEVGWFNVYEGTGNDDFKYWLLDTFLNRSYYNFLFRAFPHGKLFGVLIIMGVLIYIQHQLLIEIDKEQPQKTKFIGSIVILSVVFTVLYPALSVVIGFIIYITSICIAIFILPKTFPRLFFNLINRK